MHERHFPSKSQLAKLLSKKKGPIKGPNIILEEDENMYNSYNHYYFRPFLYQNYTSRNIINSRIKNRVINPILISSGEEVNIPIGDSGHVVKLETL